MDRQTDMRKTDLWDKHTGRKTYERLTYGTNGQTNEGLTFEMYRQTKKRLTYGTDS